MAIKKKSVSKKKRSKKPKDSLDSNKIPSGTSWKRILLEIYEYAPHSYGDTTGCPLSDNEHPLVKKLKITGYEAMLGVSFLKDNGLIRQESVMTPGGLVSKYYLTEKGFNVALELEKQKSDFDIKFIVMFFTVVLGVTTMLSYMFEFIEYSNKVKGVLYCLVLISFALLVGKMYFDK